jgi:hypothetical protein
MEARRRARMRARFNGAAARAQTVGASTEMLPQFEERRPVARITNDSPDVMSSEDERPNLDPEKSSSDSSDAAQGDESGEQSSSSEDNMLGGEGGGMVEDDDFEGNDLLGS